MTIAPRKERPAMTPPPPHREVLVTHGAREAWVDEGIADLVLEMWRAGVDTVESCQGSPEGYAWIAFPSSADLAMFVALAAEYDTQASSLYNRIVGARYPQPRWPRRRLRLVDRWQYSVRLIDRAVEWRHVEGGIQETASGPPDIAVVVSAHLPFSDVAELVRRLRAQQEPTS
jgi:threonine dehydrogenase-like Zn-dependent dehydrogenase